MIVFNVFDCNVRGIANRPKDIMLCRFNNQRSIRLSARVMVVEEVFL